MRRPVRSRIFAAICAVWLTTILSEPASLHTCAMHASSHGGSHAPLAAGMHQHHATQERAPASSHATCTCIGGCCVAVAATLPVAPVVSVRSTESRTVPALTSPTISYRPATFEYARPPSHAPPFFTA